MSYQVLARKWRPRQFSELVGQTHVVRALSNALAEQRVHHALLLSGTRGIGKTTIARIVTRCLNCEQGVGAQPCGECAICREIDEGRFLDLIEVDAASRTKVDDTRELLDNVQYAPSRGRYKVYLIDEVHMLSNHSFNALLKTLEEPPEHVVFILATTDPQKLPVTILSRCLQFHLKRLPAAEIEAQMQRILEEEKVASEPAALRLLARSADGSMRDGLSLLDQAIAYCGGELKEADIREMLGSIDRAAVMALLEAIAAGDGSAMMQALHAFDEQAPDYSAALQELAVALQQIALQQLIPEIEDTEPDAPASRLADSIEPEDAQVYYQIAVQARRDLEWAPDHRSGFEMALLRMLAFRPVEAADHTRKAAAHRPKIDKAEKKTPAAEPADSAGKDWDSMIQRLELTGMSAELARHCSLKQRNQKAMVLAVAPAHTHLLTDRTRQRLTAALQSHLETEIKVRFETAEEAPDTPASRQQREQTKHRRQAVEAIEQDPTVQALQKTFGAVLKPESVHTRSGGKLNETNTDRE